MFVVCVVTGVFVFALNGVLGVVVVVVEVDVVVVVDVIIVVFLLAVTLPIGAILKFEFIFVGSLVVEAPISFSC